jgi:hypothetical protein
MFNTPVSEVKGTKILVAQLTNGMQFTVFQNEVIMDTKQLNAMILPVPLNGTCKISLFDMSKYQHFFGDCEACFPKAPLIKKGSWFSSSAFSESVSENDSLVTETLEDVVRLGSYKVRYE